ncbi:Transcription factor bHLH96 [Hibiscus syriacus]|uniref:Transcription factor bHLH96 n=1 Tax=Hibiscus syriacus TaxID=106335 RepID=A0A6A2Z866_HIBSY|nr:transcription factor bHLH94-like [Hibiscus syriacus]KAE8687305.1 Transcription factor bHLH96 [Hibiscus syriacus]
MTLEAVIFQQDLFGHNSNWNHDFGLEKQESKDSFAYFPDNQTPEINDDFTRGDYWVASSPTSPMAALVPHLIHHHCPNSSCDAANVNVLSSTYHPSAFNASSTTCNRRKRRRSKTRKNKEEIENQRMTHIAVERNRRKQMNQYLSVLRSLMPESYVQTGDQASIIGGAINFVKELEHHLQWLSAEIKVKERSNTNGNHGSCSSVFDEFFTFPQYSTNSKLGVGKDSISINDESLVETQSVRADIEVTMVESHVNLRIRSKKRPAQLLKVVSWLNIMGLSVLHLNVTTVDQTVLYSLGVKVEDDSKLSSVDDIATAVNQLLCSIQEDGLLN